MSNRIVITGGPGTGKTTLINFLISEGYPCKNEVSREIIIQAQKLGIDQLFLKDPILFSDKLLEGRIAQFNESSTEAKLTFYDRAIPDITAYLNYIDVAYPAKFIEAGKKHIYDTIFITPPWEAIFISDDQRYENFEQAVKIHQNIKKTYLELGYNPIEVPFGSVQERIEFILNH